MIGRREIIVIDALAGRLYTLRIGAPPVVAYSLREGKKLEFLCVVKSSGTSPKMMTVVLSR
jgi:hypothetical protein